MTAPIIQNGKFDLESLKAFAQQADQNAKVLVNHDTGAVSIKGAITSRLPGTKGARLEAANLFLETLKQEYGETIALELSKDADVASLKEGKPLSARRIQSVLARAEARLQQLEDRLHEADHLIEEFGTATIKKLGEQFGENLSLKTFFPDIENAAKMKEDLKAILATRDAKLGVEIEAVQPHLPESFQKAADREAVDVLTRLGIDHRFKADAVTALTKNAHRQLLEYLPKEGTITPNQYAKCLREHPEVLMSPLLEHFLASDFPELAKAPGLSSVIDTLRSAKPDLKGKIDGCKLPSQFQELLKSVKTALETYAEQRARTIDIETLKYDPSAIKANFTQAAKDAVHRILEQIGAADMEENDLEDFLRTEISRLPYPKDQTTIELDAFKALFASTKTKIIGGELTKELASKFPNFSNKTGLLIGSTFASLCANDPTLQASIEQCSSKAEFDEIATTLVGHLSTLENEADALRPDFLAAFKSHVDTLAQLSGIDKALIEEALQHNNKVDFSEHFHAMDTQIAIDRLPHKEIQTRMRQNLDKAFGELEASIQTVKSWKLPYEPAIQTLILENVCKRNMIKGDVAKLLGKITEDERLCPNDIAQPFLNIQSKEAFNQAMSDTIARLGPVIEELFNDVFANLGKALGADEHELIATVLYARLMPTYQGPHFGLGYYDACKDFLEAYRQNPDFPSNPPLFRTIDKLIEHNVDPFTTENLTDGLEMLIVNTSQVDIHGMRFDAIRQEAQAIFEDSSLDANDKQERVEALLGQYTENQIQVLTTIRMSNIDDVDKTRLNNAVRDLGACGNELFVQAMQEFMIPFASGVGKGVKADAKSLVKLMQGLEASYKAFVEGLEDAPGTHDAAFLKRCALCILGAFRQVANTYSALNDKGLQALRKTLNDQLKDPKHVNERTAIQSALEFLDIVRGGAPAPQNA